MTISIGMLLVQSYVSDIKLELVKSHSKVSSCILQSMATT